MVSSSVKVVPSMDLSILKPSSLVELSVQVKSIYSKLMTVKFKLMGGSGVGISGILTVIISEELLPLALVASTL